MGRFPVLIQGIIFCLCFTTGCSTFNVGSPVSWYKNRKVTEDTEKPEKKSRNPFVKKVDKKKDDQKEAEKSVAKNDDDAKSEESKETKEVAEKAPEKTDSKKNNADSMIKLVKHDEKTLQMIEEELKNSPPEKREKLYNEFKELDSQVVQRIININKMVRQASEMSPSHQQTPNQQVASQTPTSQNPVQQAIQQKPRVAQPGMDTNHQAMGLGAASPWANRPNNQPVQNQITNKTVPINNQLITPANQIQPAPLHQAFGHVPQQGNFNNPQNPQQIPNPNVPLLNPRQIANLANPGLIPNQGNLNRNPLAQHPGVSPNAGLKPSVAMIQTPVMNPSGAVNQPPQFPQSNPNQQKITQTAQNNQVPLMPQQYSVPEYRTRAGMSQNTQWKDSLQNLISLAESEISQIQVGQSEIEKQYYIEKQVYLRLLYLMAGQQNRALEVIPGINSQDQEFWTHTFWSLSNYFDIENIPDKSNRATQTISQLKTAIQRLQSQANLEIKNVNFSDDVDNFGNYKKYDRDEFDRGETVLVYAELHNLKQQFSENKYHSEILSTIEIYKAGQKEGLAAKPINFKPIKDSSNNIRNDYFLTYQLIIPEDLSLGPYTMKLTVKDILGNKLATNKLNFTVK